MGNHKTFNVKPNQSRTLPQAGAVNANKPLATEQYTTKQASSTSTIQRVQSAGEFSQETDGHGCPSQLPYTRISHWHFRSGHTVHSPEYMQE